MNERRQGIGRLLRFGSIALASALITVSCAAAEPAALPTPSPTAAESLADSPSPAPSPSPGPTLAVSPSASAAPVASGPLTSASPGATQRTAAAFAPRTIMVVIPDAASPSPGSDAAASVISSSPGVAGTPVPFVAEDSVDTTDKRLNVTVGGETVYIRNGGRIEMGDGLAVEIFIDPYPPDTLHSTLDVYVTKDGEPLPGASVDVEFDMLSMLHGPFFGPARDIGGGHHLATLDYIMFGAWDQFVTIRIGLDRIRFPVVIVAYP